MIWHGRYLLQMLASHLHVLHVGQEPLSRHRRVVKKSDLPGLPHRWYLISWYMTCSCVNPIKAAG